MDTDFSRLFTHSYSSLMALCRWHFVFHSEFRNVALKKGWVPVTTAETMEYKRSIKAFQRITVCTRLLCWNEKRFYLEQTFQIKGQIYAKCHVEGLIRGPQGTLKPPEVFRTLGIQQSSPEFPDQISAWLSTRAIPDSTQS